ncbi:uncharacterized protein LOC104907871 isoform X2 [Beta vulgaris subsp. vulgaris]|uniref:uncharacterized protein LOC104907871 isoform X2 n=1 Tax=Beta vulgaris subsp. vulgaris TaxID=3555 RepID=UPI002036C7B4|nr:uncharacterized protein LOC104907871 isoform X2 [Beta vulgaris subsp. vulgaris]
MESTQVNVSNGFEDVGHQLIRASAAAGPPAVPSFDFSTDVVVASSENNKQSNLGDQHLQASSMHPGTICDTRVQIPSSTPGVSNCYVFKSRLQEYAQKVGLATPVYETIKEGPSHEPSFRSAVMVGGARYESLSGFFNRKAAEQSAAEVALMELSKSGDKNDSIAVPVHQTGLCKNLLQEYAQKMNYAIPTYICRKDDSPGRTAHFSCTVEIGAIQYIGAAARTKKEAEIKAARTALLAIRSLGTAGAQNLDGKPQYTVVPGKRKMPETAPLQVDTVKVKKPKKPRFKKKRLNRLQPCDSGHQTEAGITGLSVLKPDYLVSLDQDNVLLKNDQLNKEVSLIEVLCGPEVGVVDSSQTQVTTSCQPYTAESEAPLANASRNHDVGGIILMTNAPNSVQSDMLLPDSSIVQEESAVVPGKNHAREENNDEGVGKVTPVISQDDPATGVADKDHMGGENNVCTNLPYE